jgi:hypothetical protein
MPRRNENLRWGIQFKPQLKVPNIGTTRDYVGKGQFLLLAFLFLARATINHRARGKR